MFFGKGSKQRRLVGDCLLAAEGLVIAVCDQSSVFNRATISADAWASTTTTSSDRLFEYNSYMCAEMSSDRAIIWILVLWGVFRLRVELHERLDEMPSIESSAHLIGNCREASIDLSSGRLGWIDVENAANSSWREVATIPPGRYLCRLTGDERPDHWNLAGPADYPPDDEDWVLHLVLLSAGSSEPHR
jgi:hypothetical protein